MLGVPFHSILIGVHRIFVVRTICDLLPYASEVFGKSPRMETSS